ncbi:MAG TPA: hypothetical protein EYP14_00810 [Planctomycetaceae bacterium]|nr:hypothetical protein [Planctomycetaceae bacterium]
MPSYNKYDPRLESLVVETKTAWDPDVAELPDEERRWLAAELHRHPDQASKIQYVRVHTGMIRLITVTAADVERLRQQTGG